MRRQTEREIVVEEVAWRLTGRQHNNYRLSRTDFPTLQTLAHRMQAHLCLCLFCLACVAWLAGGQAKSLDCATLEADG